MPAPVHTLPLLKADAVIAAGATVDLVATTPDNIAVQEVRIYTDAVIYFFVQGGNALNVLDVEIILQRSANNIDWFDLPVRIIPQNGLLVVIAEEASQSADLNGVDFLRIREVKNNAPDGDVTVNVGVQPYRN